MRDSRIYSARAVFDEMKKTLHQYLEAQYHVWDAALIESRRAMLETEGVTFQEPRIEATPYYVTGLPYEELDIPEAAKRLLSLASKHPLTGIPEAPYTHQAESLEEFLTRRNDVIVATGTGSGKTESFLMPILGLLAEEATSRQKSWSSPGCRALLLYPMNALVNDQLTRLRRLLSAPDVAKFLRGNRSYNATFGMYTSRTPYPGVASAAKDKTRLLALIQSAFLDLSEEARTRLKKEGKWPAKDLTQYIENGFQTGSNDSEMFSRHEMQSRCPDILVTNYSMLEYMLLRPVERSIFDQTSAWLEKDSKNALTVVLDEAHMYRGSGGAEVAFLLRRLHSRLKIPRERIRYILTSASLGTTPEAEAGMKVFASDLTGRELSIGSFKLIRGKAKPKEGARPATSTECAILAGYNFSTLHEIVSDLNAAVSEFRRLVEQLGNLIDATTDCGDVQRFQQVVYQWVSGFGPAALIANVITSKPTRLQPVADLVFPGFQQGEQALESLLAIMSFAKEQTTGRVFAPVRSHLFFRGISGVYACVDPDCRHKVTARHSVLGSLRDTPALRCDCGARVYELLTHRDCGAAFLKGFVSSEFGDFLWHEPSRGILSDGGLIEAHFLVETSRRATGANGRLEGSSIWLHKITGRLDNRAPPLDFRSQYIELVRPDGLVQIENRPVLTFDRECPVCTRRWQADTTKIMNLATKGEAPFAQLIKTQVALQPATIQPTEQSPNGGRKSLLFSDGRQKAARLARDIPREIESDVFRQLILLAARELKSAGREPTIGPALYVAFLHVLASSSLLVFDGTDRERLLSDVANHRRYYEGNLIEALEEPPSNVPPRYNVLLLKQLGSPFYSFHALTLAHLVPAIRARRQVLSSLHGIDEQTLTRVAAPWIQSFASEYAVDPTLPPGIRTSAAGYPTRGGRDANGSLSAAKLNHLRQYVPDLDHVLTVLAEIICRPQPNVPGLFLDPTKISLALADERSNWYQCSQCSGVAPVDWWGACPTCLSTAITTVQPGATEYLRARKAFFRDPVREVLENLTKPFNLTVEEHTAQLSYRDVDEPSTTTEDYERRFRDILVSHSDTSIDVLSSTTTMEVGIDIGSLVAVGLRNVPPLRQNYQQRAGRAGRRGAAVSTVVTYAQNGPHDNHYFRNPEPIISGEPTLPHVDTRNRKIIERHIRAQLIQSFFHSQVGGRTASDIYSVLGETMAFYTGSGPFSFTAFQAWIVEADAREACRTMHSWIPSDLAMSPENVAAEFIHRLIEVRPASEDQLEPSQRNLIEFLFGRGFLPAYAFPRDLCALQIEAKDWVGNMFRVKTVQRPQQGLNIALSEYAPGRMLVVDKKTYRVGTVAASGASTVEDRAAPLFADARYYVHCPECDFTAGFRMTPIAGKRCPLCNSVDLVSTTVIQPEVVYPEGGQEVDEYDDDQQLTRATSAQLSVPDDDPGFHWNSLYQNLAIAFRKDQQLVMVNKGEEDRGQYPGFFICRSCGKSEPSRVSPGPHKRDYLLTRASGRCNGDFESVYLGYGFSSDVMLMRIPLLAPLRFDPVLRREKEPIASALQSFAEALVICISHELDIDIREINAGYRFVGQNTGYVADLFVYDTLSGGAGYATEAGHVVEQVMDRMEILLGSCSCSTSCDKCLRHYGNRFHHEILDRTLALDLLRYIRGGTIPAAPSLAVQRYSLAPLQGLLSLAGWNVVEGANVPLIADKDGRTAKLYSFPSLFVPSAFGYTDGDNDFAFSPFELARDLPGTYLEIV